MREQIITPRVGRGQPSKGRAASGGVVQRPARRGVRGGGSSGAGGTAWQRAVAYAPTVLKALLAVCIGLALFAGYRAAASASFFQLNSIEVDGAARASKDEIKAIVRRGVGTRGVWQADLAAIGAELKNQPWVRAAVVSRVLPSGVRVQVVEREPRMVARTSAGRFVWVDDDGVMLGTAQPSDKMPPFFIRGLDEAPTDAARTDNRERIRSAVEMARAWEASGVAKRISEVSLGDLRDVRAQLSGADSQIEVRLGRDDFGKRLTRALKVLDDLRDSPRGPVVRLDATQEKRVIVGFGTGAQSSGESASGTQRVGSAEAQGQADAATRERADGLLTNAPTRANADAAQKKERDERRSSGVREVKRASQLEAKRVSKEKGAEKQTRRDRREDKATGRTPAAALAERPRRVG